MSKQDGRIFFWDHEQGPGQDKYDSVDLLCGSFSQFMKSLFGDEVNEDIWELLGRVGTVEDVDEFIRNGGDIHGVGSGGRNLLESAARYCNVDLVEYCLDNGVDIGRAMRIAAVNGCVNVIQVLVRWGVDLNGLLEDGRTALDWANYDSEIAERLRGIGALTAAEVLERSH